MKRSVSFSWLEQVRVQVTSEAFIAFISYAGRGAVCEAASIKVVPCSHLSLLELQSNPCGGSFDSAVDLPEGGKKIGIWSMYASTVIHAIIINSFLMGFSVATMDSIKDGRSYLYCDKLVSEVQFWSLEIRVFIAVIQMWWGGAGLTV